ncbi:MAG: hypothetical protein JO336_09290 [Acidobacteriia bacterium]|nr:hypothetical protein [Terriglobia bacterium]MBV9742857.1 hypothetical protein [Terriglobia bacterium]
MANAQLGDAIFLSSSFAPLNTASLQFTDTFDPVAKTFSYQTGAGQMYEGMSVSMSTTGSFNSALSEYQWTTTAFLGSSTWTGTSTGVWVGDPITINSTYVYKGVTYAVTGTINLDGLQSSGTLTYTAPPGTPNNICVAGCKWPSTDSISAPPSTLTVMAVGFDASLGLNGVLPFPDGGAGNVQLQVSPVPEPTFMGPLVAAILLLLARKTNSSARS